MNSDTPRFVASNANHNQTVTSKSRSDRSFWDRFSYHSSQLSAKLARSFPSRKKGYVRPPRVLRDELDEGENAFERILAKAKRVTAMSEELLFGRRSDAVEREDRISEEARHKTIADELREIEHAETFESFEQRIDSLQRHLQTELFSCVRKQLSTLRPNSPWVRVVADAVILSAREQGPLSTLDAMEFPDRRGTSMANEP